MSKPDVYMAWYFWTERGDPSRYDLWDEILKEHADIRLAWEQLCYTRKVFDLVLQDAKEKYGGNE